MGSLNYYSPEQWDAAGARARADAEEILRAHWDGQLPVKPIELANKNGAWVYSSDLKDSASGMLVKADSAPPVIYVDNGDGFLRQRFTIAHELGHLVAHRQEAGDDAVSYVDFRNSTSNPVEYHANEFAGALLMPEEHFTNLVRAGKSDAELARLFKVSSRAVAVRRKTLGLGA
ncbi:ImmA/IrrE family metallo-endopeptidase [Pseudoclavibacter sp. VKM Ac-2867]|uniref:ImmA/IrrE family metallo-endopeptidase n=1 Tax=Pseudoclavibacter sp. VKM Ac-2867 TaxID=2783829 RepID=UPI001889D55F|nr:ImmA/IrrE family metallo-endopeptidase [Pseudoclavibacter sp. VKM Ac-2867]MBF4459413.1 ImmA/IrrE family metallo-endopeptidase [Pseudoclavibacter sp. VKM Ac-2867]